MAAELLIRVAIFSVGPFPSLATRWDSTPGSLFWKASQSCSAGLAGCTSQPGPLKMLNFQISTPCMHILVSAIRRLRYVLYL